jgi:hypothetical protein
VWPPHSYATTGLRAPTGTTEGRPQTDGRRKSGRNPGRGTITNGEVPMCATISKEFRRESGGLILAGPGGGWGVGHTPQDRFTGSCTVHSLHRRHADCRGPCAPPWPVRPDARPVSDLTLKRYAVRSDAPSSRVSQQRQMKLLGGGSGSGSVRHAGTARAPRGGDAPRVSPIGGLKYDTVRVPQSPARDTAAARSFASEIGYQMTDVLLPRRVFASHTAHCRAAESLSARGSPAPSSKSKRLAAAGQRAAAGRALAAVRVVVRRPGACSGCG